jgi:hypothetical protein
MDDPAPVEITVAKSADGIEFEISIQPPSEGRAWHQLALDTWDEAEAEVIKAAVPAKDFNGLDLDDIANSVEYWTEAARRCNCKHLPVQQDSGLLLVCKCKSLTMLECVLSGAGCCPPAGAIQSWPACMILSLGSRWPGSSAWAAAAPTPGRPRFARPCVYASVPDPGCKARDVAPAMPSCMHTQAHQSAKVHPVQGQVEHDHTSSRPRPSSLHCHGSWPSVIGIQCHL